MRKDMHKLLYFKFQKMFIDFMLLYVALCVKGYEKGFVNNV